MTPDELAALRKRWFTTTPGVELLMPPKQPQLGADALTLFQHIAQLEAENAALKAGIVQFNAIVDDQKAENAALRYVARPMAKLAAYFGDERKSCPFCGMHPWHAVGAEHSENCPITKARALLAKEQ